jgi:hypothetical protein
VIIHDGAADSLGDDEEPDEIDEIDEQGE